MRQLGLGQTAGSLQLQRQRGCSHTLWHGCTPGQKRLQSGSSHLVWHSGQSLFGQLCSAQTTAHRGRSHFSLQLEVSGAPVHLVSQRGSSHSGAQLCSHCGDSQRQWHLGRQSAEVAARCCCCGGGGGGLVAAGPGTSKPGAGVAGWPSSSFRRCVASAGASRGAGSAGEAVGDGCAARNCWRWSSSPRGLATSQPGDGFPVGAPASTELPRRAPACRPACAAAALTASALPKSVARMSSRSRGTAANLQEAPSISALACQCSPPSAPNQRPLR
mmetsp:Transcript_109273/g.319896  ORF Transcript_109273/g.319896 Transcript_109273/m.319896 type:complete len:274 (-) Transcript_109273:88-909(-)